MLKLNLFQEIHSGYSYLNMRIHIFSFIRTHCPVIFQMSGFELELLNGYDL